MATRLYLCRDCVVRDSISVWFPKAREWRFMTIEQFAQYRLTQTLLGMVDTHEQSLRP